MASGLFIVRRYGLAAFLVVVGIAGIALVSRRGVRVEEESLALCASFRTVRILWADIVSFQMNGHFWFENWGTVSTSAGQELALPGIVVLGRRARGEPRELVRIRDAWLAAR